MQSGYLKADILDLGELAMIKRRRAIAVPLLLEIV
jgi:hypothetical protein